MSHETNHEENDDSIEAMLRRQFEGPIADQGFSEHVMQRLPPRRRRVAWPVWSGVLAGVAACVVSLLFSPLLHAGWRDVMHGDWSTSAITLLSVMAGLSVLACGWTFAEAENR
ncbi:DUF5056 domain-containing protein [Rhodanobacter sp. L36]|uniref:DUF5056 domain-containing protein n=1 Tax=Rhodanobacter sp. L36 TaxID=1747221 RepID=UPI00131D0FBD|nr:DUF5056 domain-containing protein [Rhodanobacter sp. L36]